MTVPTTDYIYAYALSKTLTKVSSPATVGLYSSCLDRINMILKQLEDNMDREALKIEQEYDGRRKPRSISSCTGFFALIFRLLFFRPVWTKENQHQGNIRFIYVHFSAWHFAGSDLLWAGIAIQLFQAMQMSFGKLKIALYRVVQHDEDEEIKEKIVEDDVSNDWNSKKICCCPLWCLILFILLVLVILLVLLFIKGFPKSEDTPPNGEAKGDGMSVVEGLFIATLGVPAASALKFIFQLCKNLIICQDLNIKRGMDNEQISSQLGFMNIVRKEVWFLSRFIQFMEVFERRRIRVMLKITNLDRCSPKKIVAVLEAIDILLSDQESPFISILAVNSSVLLEKVKFADGCFCKEDRAHMLLNRIVTLPFTIPPLNKDVKRNLFYSIISNSKFPQRNMRLLSDVPLVKIASRSNEPNPLINKNTAALDVEEEELEGSVGSILKSSERTLTEYMLDDAISMRRVINSIWVSTIIMKTLNIEFPKQEDIAAWVVLANQWPCRLSWIIQCVEDTNQRAAIDGRNACTDHSKTLWEVFNESREELYVMSAQIEDLLEQDGDPEVFEKLLKDDDFKFTINNLETFEVVMVNLDQSIRKELALIRGTFRLKDCGLMRNLAPLPVTAIIKMSTADICQEMERMNFDIKYIEIVKDNKLNGSTLIFSDADDLKALLDMTFGEWAIFRLHFLSSISYIQPQHNDRLPAVTQSPKFLHVPHYYSSTTNLAHSCI
ncbi:NTPase KAP family P-loop domain-containing protein 1 [Melanotaenia boesemani]|uniref:NTPase KAP family P-loop domain-containing protein 1 n=1 Tax=Melanotaenia boesemani TaxID=1250792 RepID=UPI001C05A424|nr:NTPase KAP family P-loop domain-containing protein 1 [Melanotaenia boesemani]